MDTLDIIGFLAEHPQFRPAPLRDLAAAYWSAWQWLQQDYRRDRHLIDMFGFGRGNYSYMTPARQWQQTTSFLAKAAGSLRLLREALEREKVASFPARPHLPEVARFEWFRRAPERPAGVWLVRQGPLRFALPFTTGPRAGVADYLPAPHGLPGFAVPVEQLAPALVPHLELEDGRVLVASDGADLIVPAADGRSVRAVWRRFSVVGGPPAEFVDAGLTTEVTWTLEGDPAVVRREVLTAARPMRLRCFQLMVPSSGTRMSTMSDEQGRRADRFSSRDGELEIALLESSLPLAHSIEATGDAALGKGARGPIPLVLRLRAEAVTLTPGAPLRFTVRLRARESSGSPESAAR